MRALRYLAEHFLQAHHNIEVSRSHNQRDNKPAARGNLICRCTSGRCALREVGLRIGGGKADMTGACNPEYAHLPDHSTRAMQRVALSDPPTQGTMSAPAADSTGIRCGKIQHLLYSYTSSARPRIGARQRYPGHDPADLIALCHFPSHCSHHSDNTPEIQTTCDPVRHGFRLKIFGWLETGESSRVQS